MKRLFLLTLSIFFFFSLYGQEENYNQFGIKTGKSDTPKGLETGMKAPDFKITDQKGETMTLSEIVENKPVVLFFYRGYWCPVCSRYLKNYADSLSLIKEKGARVIAVTPERLKNIQKTEIKTGIEITIISDEKGNIMKDYGVDFYVTRDYQVKIRKGFNADIAKINAQEEAQLPVPATYIIDKNRKIIARQFDPDYRNRASVYWMLENLP